MMTRGERTSMQKGVLGVIIGLVGVELVVRAVSPVLGPPLEYFAPVAQAKVTQLARLSDAGRPPNMIFIGSSTVVEGIDVAAFESHSTVDAYNAALNGADTHIVRRFVLEEIVPRARPAAVVYGVSPGAFTDESPHAEQYDRAPATAVDRDPLVDHLAQHLYMYRYRNTLRDPLTINTFLRALRNRSLKEGIVERMLSDLTADGDTVNRTVGGGATTPIEIPRVTRDIVPDEIPAEAKSDITRLVNALEAQDIAFSFVIMPTAEPQQGFVAAVRRLADELDVPAVDARPAIRSTQYFYDGVHLNAEGATRLGSFLAQELETAPGITRERRSFDVSTLLRSEPGGTEHR